MFVNRYNFKLNTETTATTINIPISLEATPVDQSELIESEFVEKEIEKSVNPIIDYESIRLIPVDNSNIVLPSIVYSLNFISGSNYKDIGFTDSDLILRKNKFKRSFLQLDFYDSELSNSQNFLYRSTLYCRVTNDMFRDSKLRPTNELEVDFKLYNPITTPNGISEGYYLYNYKDEIPKDIYMKATFNNAKTGVSHGFMTNNLVEDINYLVNKLHTKYILKRNSNGYFYQLDSSATNINVDSSTGGTINLYEIEYN